MITLRSVGYNDCALFTGSSYEAMTPDSMREMIGESVLKLHNGRFFELFAIMEGDVCVGFVSLYAHSDTDISCGPEIKPPYRKQGFAYLAVKRALEHAKQLGFTKAIAQVRQDNIASIALHQKLGFTAHRDYFNKRGRPVLGFEKTL